jgi:hypothetical protein
MDATEHLEKADAVERPLLDREVEFLNPMLICARHGESFLLLPAAGLAGSSHDSSPAVKHRTPAFREGVSMCWRTVLLGRCCAIEVHDQAQIPDWQSC